MRLSEYADPLVYSDYIFAKSKGGKKASSDGWGYTRRYLDEYGDPADSDSLIALFTDAGLSNEIEAIRWLFKQDQYIE